MRLVLLAYEDCLLETSVRLNDALFQDCKDLKLHFFDVAEVEVFDVVEQIEVVVASVLHLNAVSCELFEGQHSLQHRHRDVFPGADVQLLQVLAHAQMGLAGFAVGRVQVAFDDQLVLQLGSLLQF